MVSICSEPTSILTLWKKMGALGPPMTPVSWCSMPSSTFLIPKDLQILAWNMQSGEPESTTDSIRLLGGECRWISRTSTIGTH